MENIRLPLIAEVLKTYRSQAEERALADFVMYICDITHEDARDMSKEQLQNHIANVLTKNDDVPLRPRGPSINKVESTEEMFGKKKDNSQTGDVKNPNVDGPKNPSTKPDESQTVKDETVKAKPTPKPVDFEGKGNKPNKEVK